MTRVVDEIVEERFESRVEQALHSGLPTRPTDSRPPPLTYCSKLRHIVLPRLSPR